tara:strand:- start:101 stop:976 length:876 start_codon:yes stop_codon:yes gene_type:complete
MPIQQMMLGGGAGGDNIAIQFKVYGAGGGLGSAYSGTSDSHSGGDGGYTQGTFTVVPAGTVFYIVVGQGGISQTPGSRTYRYNGGAVGSKGGFYGGSGGGATHVALVTGELSSLSSQTNQVILVAGGGGGGGNNSIGGDGGGTSGQSVSGSSQGQFMDRTGGAGGTQIGGGVSVGSGAVNGSFGKGGYTVENLNGGGGGGWYGGGGYQNSTGGGGGSGYVSTQSFSWGSLTNTLNQQGNGKSGGIDNGGPPGGGSGPSNGTPAENGQVLVYRNGVLDTTFNYTGSVQTFTV